jgi:hypothetical protein
MSLKCLTAACLIFRGLIVNVTSPFGSLMRARSRTIERLVRFKDEAIKAALFSA